MLVETLLVTTGLVGASVASVYVYDRFIQKKHTLLRNYPVIGHFRYFAEHYGEYMRQYQYSMDWEERPFNRLVRNWIYQSSKGQNNKISFGSEVEPEFRLTHTLYPLEPTPYTQTVKIGDYTPQSVFNISGMSYGAISRTAVESLSKGAAKAGCWMNTGEGGLSKYHLSGGCDIVFQIGTAKYGVRDSKGYIDLEKLKEVASIEQVKMFEIKLSQGAKPGKGGILPANKITDEIAAIRGIDKGADSNSPNGHNEIKNADDLAKFILMVKTVTRKPTGIKMVYTTDQEVQDMFYAFKLHRIEPDFITLDGPDGGTGSAPDCLASYVGIPLDIAIPKMKSFIRTYNCQTKIIASGKLVTPAKVAWALELGADFVTTARGFMFSLGCIQALKCNSGKCPTGITASDERLIKGLVPADKAERVYRYCKQVQDDLMMIVNSKGLDNPKEL